MTLLPVLLPEGSTSKVSVNDKLTAGQIIAEKKDKGVEEVIHVSQLFNISSNKIINVLRKNLGDSVAVGDILAIKKGKLGLGTKKIISDFSGTILKIDEEKGDVLIHINSTGKNIATIISPVDGTVDFCNNDKIVIKTDKEAILAKEAVGQDASGELIKLDGEEVDFSKVTHEVAEKIVLGKNFEKGAIAKVLALGGLGIISVKIEQSLFEDLREKGSKSPVLAIEDEDFQKLGKHIGKKIYLDPKNKSIIIL